jgi:hypothetical protein
MKRKHTSPSVLPNIISKLLTAFFATALINNGSNRAESSSLATFREILIPSFMPGGERAPFANACATDSLRRLEERERYWASKLDRARRTMIVSGLWNRLYFIFTRFSRVQYAISSGGDRPLMVRGVHRISMNGDLRKEFMEQS